jgi:hypothetical protein
MTEHLSQQFRDSLIDYLKNPNNTKNQRLLVAVSFAIYADTTKKYGLEPDGYMIYIEHVIKPAVNGIKIHPHLGEILGAFKRELSLSNEHQENQAFHALNMALEMFLRKNFINLEKNARDKLADIDASIQQLRANLNPYADELNAAYVKLKVLVDKHFALSPTMQIKEHANFERKINFVCSEYKTAIESNAKIKSTFYSFLGMISSFFMVIGWSISMTFKEKSNFFQDASQIAGNILKQSNFSVPFVEIKN